MSGTAMRWPRCALVADFEIPSSCTMDTVPDWGICPAPLGLVFLVSQVVLGLASKVVGRGWVVADGLHDEGRGVNIG